MPSHVNLGKLGEAQAAVHLQKIGYKILQINYRNQFGEIDIIAQDKDVLCFVEVKTRKSLKAGDPLEAIHSVKQRKLVQMALLFLKSKKLRMGRIRFDVLAITKSRDDKDQIKLVKNAFDLNDSFSLL